MGQEMSKTTIDDYFHMQKWIPQALSLSFCKMGR